MSFKFNNSNGFLNYSQRNNEFIYESKGIKGVYKTDYSTCCNVTTITAGLFYAGWDLPKGKYKQEEDNLADFIFHNQEVLDYFFTNYKSYAEAWKQGDNKNGIAPNELHKVLEFAIRKWLCCKYADTFIEGMSFKVFLKHLYEDKISIPTSMTFGSYGHFELAVGVNTSFYNEQDFKDFINNKKQLDYTKISLIYDDPFGKLIDKNLGRWDKNQSGNDNEMTFAEFIKHSKPLNQELVWCHLLKKPCSNC